MQRIIVIGNCGAGKSTFAKKLSQINGLELIHLDQYYYTPDWEGMNSKEWQELVKKVSSKLTWIMDGNYCGTMDLRISRADTIIFLNYSTAKCLWRITKRILKNWGKERPDMVKGCKERFNLKFYHYVASFNLKRRDKLLSKLEKYKKDKQILIFSNDKESNSFLKRINTEPNNA